MFTLKLDCNAMQCNAMRRLLYAILAFPADIGRKPFRGYRQKTGFAARGSRKRLRAGENRLRR